MRHLVEFVRPGAGYGASVAGKRGVSEPFLVEDHRFVPAFSEEVELIGLVLAEPGVGAFAEAIS